MNDYGTSPSEIDYKAFLHYIEHLKKTGITARTLQSYIGNLKTYFRYLQQENYRADNPIENINIKGVPKTVLNNLLEADELEDLYYSYETHNENLSKKRNKIIIGLLVYQGLQTTELQHLKEEHVELYKGKIHVPGTKRSNGRTLELKPWQLMEFMEYVNQIRPQLLKQTQQNTEQLFISLGGSLSLHNVIRDINEELKKINYGFQNGSQIRSSVIVNWLKQHNLRKVQYMAGHRYISSTERYKQDDLESLHEMISNFHPIQ